MTAGQYCEFLNAVAKTDAYGLYNPEMYSSSFGCKIRRLGSSENYTYVVDADGVEDADWIHRPVKLDFVGDAARFANWLHNGQPTTGLQDLSTTEDGSYFLNGATSDSPLMAVTRKAGATWVIPSGDEWYKAAYYDPNKSGASVAGYWDYPTKSDTEPSNDLTTPTVATTQTSGKVAPTHPALRIGGPRLANSRTRPVPTARSIRVAMLGNGTKRWFMGGVGAMAAIGASVLTRCWPRPSVTVGRGARPTA